MTENAMHRPPVLFVKQRWKRTHPELQRTTKEWAKDQLLFLRDTDQCDQGSRLQNQTDISPPHGQRCHVCGPRQQGGGVCSTNHSQCVAYHHEWLAKLTNKRDHPYCRPFHLRQVHTLRLRKRSNCNHPSVSICQRTAPCLTSPRKPSHWHYQHSLRVHRWYQTTPFPHKKSAGPQPPQQRSTSDVR